MNCASCVTNESCDSAGGSSKVISGRTLGTYTCNKDGMIDQTKRRIGIRTYLELSRSTLYALPADKSAYVKISG
jgi:hypothetical protein